MFVECIGAEAMEEEGWLETVTARNNITVNTFPYLQHYEGCPELSAYANSLKLRLLERIIEAWM